MTQIRVLIVDDSVIARRMITNGLSVHPEIAVVGTAATGSIALTKLPQLTPDVVILDVEMPEMDGITTLKHIREQYPRLPVIMFSSLTERGAKTTFDALAAGASDYVLKPSAQAGESVESVVNGILVPKIFALARSAGPQFGHVSVAPVAPANTVQRPAVSSPRPVLGARMTPQIIAIASSTGGPNALAEVIPSLPHDLPVPVVIVQHMPPIFTRCLAERLDAKTQLKVLESQGGERLLAGTVYIAPGNFHLEVVREGDGVKTRLTSEPPENSCRPAADVLFRSVARAYGPSALAVVLTGMGQDGMLGAREIVDAGGRVLAQSGPTCVVWGMPRAVEEAGLCEAVLPLGEIASGIAQRVAAVRMAGRVAGGGG
jgi:two-component system, chemotaxis family, protein-glutamate methylesterase/glutaminase